MHCVLYWPPSLNIHLCTAGHTDRPSTFPRYTLHLSVLRRTNLTRIQLSSRIGYEDKQKRWSVANRMRFQSVHEARWKISQGWQGTGYGDRAGGPRPMKMYLGRLAHIDGFKNVYWMPCFGKFLVKVFEVFTAVRGEVKSYKEECF